MVLCCLWSKVTGDLIYFNFEQHNSTTLGSSNKASNETPQHSKHVPYMGLDV